MLLRAGLRWALMVVLAGLTACASPVLLKDAASAKDSYWQGRLSVKIFSKPVQAFSANFELQGKPAQGELVLTSPLGSTLAHMRWDDHSATLQANGEERHFDSIQALAQQVTGADLPVASLFAWLQGVNEVAPGWQADLHELPIGRISAQHIEDVQAELKIILDR